jgi:hypothetical protein
LAGDVIGAAVASSVGEGVKTEWGVGDAVDRAVAVGVAGADGIVPSDVGVAGARAQAAAIPERRRQRRALLMLRW